GPAAWRGAWERDRARSRAGSEHAGTLAEQKVRRADTSRVSGGHLPLASTPRRQRRNTTVTQPRTSSLPLARRSRRLCALALVSLVAASAASASAQAPAVNFGFGVGMRLENSTNYDGGAGAGQSR